jgi:hypothetical protein
MEVTTRMVVASSRAKESNMRKIANKFLIRFSVKSWSVPLRAAGFIAVASVLMGAMNPDNAPDQPLQAPKGVTALSGQVVDLTGNGLAGVQLLVGDAKTVSDAAGRFLVSPVIPGKTVLQIDGRHAGPKRDVDYGFYELRVETRAGLTTVLPFKNWLGPIDHAHEVKIASPTRSEVVVTTPSVPDFELRIAPGVVVRDVNGKIVDRVSVTAAPPDRLPVPLPSSANMSFFPIIQPGAACLYDAKGGIGTATMVFPNSAKELPRARATLWRYEPDGNGWAPYGIGTVSTDGRQLIPEPGAVITDFSSAECDPATRSRQPPPQLITREQMQGMKQTPGMNK